MDLAVVVFVKVDAAEFDLGVAVLNLQAINFAAIDLDDMGSSLCFSRVDSLTIKDEDQPAQPCRDCQQDEGRAEFHLYGKSRRSISGFE